MSIGKGTNYNAPLAARNLKIIPKWGIGYLVNTSRTILYYPTIALPDEAWLKQILLYWDQVATIVPARFHAEESYSRGNTLFKNSTMKYLLDENVYRTIWADRAFFRNHLEHHKMVEEFYEVVDSQEYKNFVGPQEDWQVDAKIFTDKILADTVDFLVERKLAKTKESFEYYVERKTALLYMSFLAKYLADIEAPLTIPATNIEFYRNFIYFQQNIGKKFACLSLILKDILPIPRQDVTLQKIMTFKKQRKLELQQFQEVIWKFEKDLGVSNSEDEVLENCIRFHNRIELEMQKLSDLFKDSKISVILGSLKSLIDLKSPTLWLTGAALGGNNIVKLATPFTWVGVGVAGAIQVSSFLVDERNKKRAIVRDSAFSYLYHVNEEL